MERKETAANDRLKQTTYFVTLFVWRDTRAIALLRGRCRRGSLDPIHAARMRSGEETVRVIGVRDHRPYPPAGKFRVLVIDPLPFASRVERLKDAAIALKRA